MALDPFLSFLSPLLPLGPCGSVIQDPETNSLTLIRVYTYLPHGSRSINRDRPSDKVPGRSCRALASVLHSRLSPPVIKLLLPLRLPIAWRSWLPWCLCLGSQKLQSPVVKVTLWYADLSTYIKSRLSRSYIPINKPSLA